MKTGIQDRIVAILETDFAPQYCQVTNESMHHQRGTETHFRIEMVSMRFRECSAIQRHRMVYQQLYAITPQIHALGLHLYTPEEWSGYAPESPSCIHAAKNQDIVKRR